MLLDLPVGERPLRLLLWMRRYRGLNPACQQQSLTRDLTQSFSAMMREGLAENLDSWLSQCRNSELAAIQRFAAGLAQDYDAIRAALESEWSNGQTEGQVNRLKLLKRQMYGRAKLDLLRKRMVYES